MKKGIYQHRKNKKYYKMINSECIDTTNGHDDTLMVIYQSIETGQYFVRSASEFYDGRFTYIAPLSDDHSVVLQWTDGTYQKAVLDTLKALHIDVEEVDMKEKTIRVKI